jgi:hypothetical protein
MTKFAKWMDRHVQPHIHWGLPLITGVVGLCMFSIVLATKSTNIPTSHRDPFVCLDIPAAPNRDPDSFLYSKTYDSIAGLVIVSWRTEIGEEIHYIYTVTDLAHEDAADYSIKTLPSPMAIQIIRPDRTVESWYDQIGMGNCEDYAKR